MCAGRDRHTSQKENPEGALEFSMVRIESKNEENLSSISSFLSKFSRN
jgi:hypothetical protein